MSINGIVVELMVENVENTISFYKEILAFEVEESERSDGAIYWAKLSLGGFVISLKDHSRVRKEVPYLADSSIGGTTCICFSVDDLEGYYAQVEERCAIIDHPHLTPCGSTQFSMKDNNGYVLTFERF